MQPLTEIVRTEPQQLLAGSGVEGKLDNKVEVDYGGVDEEGSKDPSVNHFKVWDDDDWDKF